MCREQRASTVWYVASVCTFVKLLPVCVCVKERKRRQPRAREECICMCLCCDWCDRCSHWTGTAKYCSSRGQMPTCHWFVLMLTRSGGFAYPFDDKMITSQVCRWCCRHIPFLLFSPFSVCASTIYIMCASQNTNKPPFFLQFPSVFSYSCISVFLHTLHTVYMKVSDCIAFYVVISMGTLHA